jgi:hypothetical protein
VATTTEIKVHSQRQCLALTPAEMRHLQEEVSVSIPLDPGIYLLKLRQDTTVPIGNREPAAMFWIYGGPVINKSTDVEVNATWASLQGYDDVLALDVKRPSNICALLFDTQVSSGQLSLSVAKV